MQRRGSGSHACLPGTECWFGRSLFQVRLTEACWETCDWQYIPCEGDLLLTICLWVWSRDSRINWSWQDINEGNVMSGWYTGQLLVVIIIPGFIGWHMHHKCRFGELKYLDSYPTNCHYIGLTVGLILLRWIGNAAQYELLVNIYLPCHKLSWPHPNSLC